MDTPREPGMGWLALLPLGAAAAFVAFGLVAQKATEERRIRAVEATIFATGRAGPVHVEPIRGDECWRASEGFRWRVGSEEGWACAGPGDQVSLRGASRRIPHDP
ncbi:MAG: hypothetical protein EPO51_16775 [Phenylobacterium sp.]|uniref:hypothetical protein n=1 Tax=Phenylobacterium sp. TaxID=1871053 RepID=UPI001201AEDF|nr:hypothetical protein [Phenylobacterium sp.]TAJ70738.1 MAG: hypothetical protein EPO51_16775 [Phenylobacterium sp.]